MNASFASTKYTWRCRSDLIIFYTLQAINDKVNNRKIILKKVEVHNLKSVDLTLDCNEFIVFTGVSGSGKSSLAFDTLYVEGQRRYIESLSTFARRQLGDMSNQ